MLWPAPGEVVDELYFNQHRHWAPRLGFAYQLNDRIVVRGGYGVFNMALHLDNINTLGTNPPTASVQVTNPTLNPLATIANPFPAALVPTNTIFNVTSAEVDRNHRDGYYQNWNVAVGYELSRAAVFEVRYVGAKGTNLDTSLTNFNSPDPDPDRRRGEPAGAPSVPGASAASACGRPTARATTTRCRASSSTAARGA